MSEQTEIARLRQIIVNLTSAAAITLSRIGDEHNSWFLRGEVETALREIGVQSSSDRLAAFRGDAFRVDRRHHDTMIRQALWAVRLWSGYTDPYATTAADYWSAVAIGWASR